jgi:streptogramin lyase
VNEFSRDLRREALSRRTFLTGSALALAAGAINWRLLADGSAQAQGGGVLGETVKTVHDRGDAVITRYHANIDSGDFGIGVDPRSDLLYVTQRVGGNIAVFDRRAEKFVDTLAIPTLGNGAHTIRFDEPTNSVWIAAGEGSVIVRLALDSRTYRPRGFTEYRPPGTRGVVKPHSLVVVGGREVWYTDDRQEQVGFLDVKTSEITVLDEHIEADGIMLEERRIGGSPGQKRRKRRRRRRRRRSRHHYHPHTHHPYRRKRRRRRAGKRRKRRRRRRPAGRPPVPGTLRRRVWVDGGKTMTVIDVDTRQVLHHVDIEQELGISQLRLHDLVFDRHRNRVWFLMRGGDRVAWMDADHPERGAQGLIEPIEGAAGLDHMDMGRNVWWTEGRSNRVGRYDPDTGEKVGYEVPVPIGYFNPHGIVLAPQWREVWFTERESICKLTFKDGRAP